MIKQQQRFEMYFEIKEEIEEYMQAHNDDEVGQGEGNAWDYDDAEYFLALSDKYNNK